jgi:hypothetical protein
MGEEVRYYTDGENTFSRMDDFGVPISNLKQIIDMKASDRVGRTAWYSYRFDR